MTTTRKPIKVIYARISTDDKGQTIENQRTAILQTGHTDALIMFSDEGVSGATNPTTRPGFSRMLKLLRKGDTIIITAMDRVSRDTVHALTLIKQLYASGIAVVSLREKEIDTTSAIGEMQLTIGMAFATYERKLIGERVKQGLAHARSQGKQLGRPHKPERAKAIELLAQGMPIPEVVAATGLNLRTIYRLKAAEKTS
ncbi:recombinase family protein [Salmonella enterica]|nr:recombinase family protein [Salmonella enterica]EGC0267625.1 recombinase family protein [Salmonella enterica]